MKPIVDLRGVSKRYGGILALDRVDLRVKRGEIFTVLGPNGAGKTTLLRIIAGIEHPDAGEIYFGGELVNESKLVEVRRRCTMVFQNTTLFNTTVFNNVAYGLKVRGFSAREIRERVRAALDTVKLNGFEGRRARTLSGGEQQRVSLARALVLETELLLLDEPTANLDPKNVSIIEEVISWLNKQQGTTIIMASHNMFQVEALTDRVAFLIQGRIQEVRRIQDLFESPSEHLASFARLDNVFVGASRVSDNGSSLIDLGNGLVFKASTRTSGNVVVRIDSKDIILSKKPFVSNATNSFEGRLVEIADFGATVKLKVDVARKQFTVQMTKHSFTEMGLNLGQRVFLSFKASSVKVV